MVSALAVYAGIHLILSVLFTAIVSLHFDYCALSMA